MRVVLVLLFIAALQAEIWPRQFYNPADGTRVDPSYFPRPIKLHFISTAPSDTTTPGQNNAGSS